VYTVYSPILDPVYTVNSQISLLYMFSYINVVTVSLTTHILLTVGLWCLAKDSMDCDIKLLEGHYTESLPPYNIR